MGDKTVRGVIAHAAAVLGAAGCPEPRADAEEIAAAVLGTARTSLADRQDDVIGPQAAALILAGLERRRRFEPLAYITGRCDYRGLVLAIDPGVNVPHPQSGQLVDVALRAPHGALVHDVGTGAGNIALSIKSERPDLLVTASDVSAAAVDTARHNAARLGLDVPFTVADGVPPGEYDLVVADLPYGDRAAQVVPQQRESEHEPAVAHYGGNGGHETIQRIVQGMTQGTMVAIQHAISQTDIVRGLLSDPDTFGDPRYAARFTIGRVI